jgi:hypothetical protein
MLLTKSCECFQRSLLHGAFTSHSSQVGCVGHTGIFTFTSQRSSWPVVMSSRAEYSGYTMYPKSFRLSYKSAGKPPSSRQFKWVHSCASTFMDPEADIWNKWQMSEPEANTCTGLSYHGYKRMLPTQTTTKVSNFHKISKSKRVVGSSIWWNLGHPLAQGARYARTPNEYAYNDGVSLGFWIRIS